MARITDDYKKALADETKKVQVAEECYGLVGRSLGKLEKGLHKFKIELAAENHGITKVPKREGEVDPQNDNWELWKRFPDSKLGKQFLEMDAQAVYHVKEEGANPPNEAELETFHWGVYETRQQARQSSNLDQCCSSR